MTGRKKVKAPIQIAVKENAENGATPAAPSDAMTVPVDAMPPVMPTAPNPKLRQPRKAVKPVLPKALPATEPGHAAQIRRKNAVVDAVRALLHDKPTAATRRTAAKPAEAPAPTSGESVDPVPRRVPLRAKKQLVAKTEVSSVADPVPVVPSASDPAPESAAEPMVRRAPLRARKQVVARPKTPSTPEPVVEAPAEAPALEPVDVVVASVMPEPAAATAPLPIEPVDPTAAEEPVSEPVEATVSITAEPALGLETSPRLEAAEQAPIEAPVLEPVETPAPEAGAPPASAALESTSFEPISSETPPPPETAELMRVEEPVLESIEVPASVLAEPAVSAAVHLANQQTAKAPEPSRPEAPPRWEFPKPEAAAPAKAWSLPDFDMLAMNMGRFVELSSKAASAYMKAREERGQPPTFSQDVSDAVRTFGQIAEHWLVDPSRLLQAQTTFSSQFFGLWADSVRRLTSGTTPADSAKTPDPHRSDKRFADPEWHDNPFFDFVRKSYLMGTDWANELVEGAESVDEATRDKARFYLRQISSALSPSNFVATNPELLRETFKESGSNLVRGMVNLAEDIAAGQGDLKIRQTDSSKFELGVNMALTPGKVVFRNDLIELLQYEPQTETVFKRPLLIVPPWINKFYVLDLNPEKSFIRWAVSQGLTVFVVSWVNPDYRHADKDFESYMREGIFAAIEAVEAATGEHDIATIGYCVGGTLLAVTLAYMAARGDHRISSATFFTAQVDFEYAGDLKVFAEETQIRLLETQMRATGFLDGSKMSQAFNMLRPEDLIWSCVVNNYVKGKDPLPFDLLAWNSDSTRMPAANHSFYLRNCYLDNKLSRGLMEVGGERLDLGRVTVPIYNLATKEDHIAPARSVFEGCRAFGGPVRLVLAASGHIAGVVNPPSRAKYGYWLGPEPKGTFKDWLAATTEQKGSWWPDWFAWIADQAPARVPARAPGGGVLDILGDAPGSYVRMKA